MTKRLRKKVTMSKSKLMEKQFDQLALKDEYSKRVDQKLNKKLLQINSNLKIMNCMPKGDEYELQVATTDQPPKKVRYSQSKEIVKKKFDSDEEQERKEFEAELYDEYEQEQKRDFMQMAVHYKNLCRTYKKQLIDSHKTIKELHSTIEQMERKSWLQKRQKTSLQLMNMECEENMKLAFSKCTAYCEKINKLSDVITTHSDKEGQEEIIFGTLKNVIKEKREIKIFAKSFSNLISYIDPDCMHLNKSDHIDFTKLNSITNETLKHLKENSLRNVHCRCGSGGCNDYQDNHSNSYKPNEDPLILCQYSDSSTSSASSLNANKQFQKSERGKNNENASSNKRSTTNRPTVEFLVKCMNLIQELFDVDCFHGVPTKINELYYKLGQMNNFKRAIQNVFAPDKNYTLEKLVNAVQITHSQLNEQLSTNLKSILHSSNLHNVIDKFNMYDEYFPLFRELLDQVMKHLEVSRLDQIMPSIRALKILATPTVS